MSGTDEPYRRVTLVALGRTLALAAVATAVVCRVFDHHLASREIEPKVVQLLLDKGANANRLTFSTRNPGGYCALGSLVESKAQESRWDDIYTIAKLLFHQMEIQKFAVRTTTGRTLWHLLASQGKARLLKLLLDWFETKFGRREFAKQSIP